MIQNDCSAPIKIPFFIKKKDSLGLRKGNHARIMETISETYQTVDSPSIAEERQEVKLHGIIFKRTFRGFYSSLLIAVVDPPANYYLPEEEEDDSDDKFVLVRLQFHGNASALRSHCKRFLKIGDRLQISEGCWQRVSDPSQTDWENQRLVVDLESPEHAKRVLKILETFCWTMKQCQAWQHMFAMNREDNENISLKFIERSVSTISEKSDEANGHGTIAGKHKQVQCLTNFLIGMMLHKLNGGGDASSADSWSGSEYLPEGPMRARALKALNEKQGVLDVAGGAGHLSMALGMAGIRSTVIDPRASVGLLNKKDRKLFRKALSKSQKLVTSGEYCLPVQDFQKCRAWFGQPISGVDHSFRHPDDNPEDIQALLPDHHLLKNCTAIVALHPDEATETIVDTAVANRIPFCVVPCCVFCRLYPHRRNNGNLVSTYDDLLDYLQAKDPSIRRSLLPFYGKNIVLWSTFS